MRQQTIKLSAMNSSLTDAVVFLADETQTEAFTRALLRALGVAGRVRSPTFELVEEYDVLDGCVFYHFDFYRFESPREFEEAGFRDMFGSGRITACEWSEKAADYLPAADLEITLTVDKAARRAHLAALSDAGKKVLNEVLGHAA